MNPMLELLATRRSSPPQLMEGPGPTPEEIARLLEIASRVPDHGKLARWRFLLFEGAARARAGEIVAGVFLADQPNVTPEAAAAERGRFAPAPLVVGVIGRPGPHAKIPEWEQVLSLGAVCMTLSVAAQAMGYATNWLTGWFAYDRRVLEALGVGPHERVAGFVHIGRCSTKQVDRERPNLAEMVTRF
jgi:nitroreductase